MLPKVANHLLHHTSRAVAAVHNQTGATIRNVLQLQSSSTPSTGNLGPWNGSSSSYSGHSGNGPNAGGAKNHSGSRFYSGYTGAGRAVTQAEPLSSNDVSQGYSDDSEDVRSQSVSGSSPRRRKSISFGIQDRSGERLSVLEAVQSHTRSHQPFADPLAGDRITRSLVSLRGHRALSHSSSPNGNVRRESTAAVSEYLDLSPPQSIAPSLITYGNDRQSSSPSSVPPTPPLEPVDSPASSEEAFATLKASIKRGSTSAVLEEVQKLREQGKLVTAAVYNAALGAMLEVRKPGESVRAILRTYNEMIASSVLPNFKTYTILILALTARDHEQHRPLWNSNGYFSRPSEHESAAIQSKDSRNGLRPSHFESAVTLFQTACSIKGPKLSPQIYADLLQSYIHFRHLIDVYASAGDINGAKEVFAAFKEACASGSFSWPADPPAELRNTVFNGRSGMVAVWNKMIEAYIRCGQPSGGIGLLEQMMDSEAGPAFTALDVPLPTSYTFSSIITGFCRAGDTDTALSWFDRLLKQDASPGLPYEGSRVPARPNAHAWKAIINTLAVEGRIEPLNRLFTQWIQLVPQDGLEVHSQERIAVLRANWTYFLQNPDLDAAAVVDLVDFMVHTVIGDDLSQLGLKYDQESSATLLQELAQKYLIHGRRDAALDLLERYVGFKLKAVHDGEASQSVDSDETLYLVKGVRSIVQSLCIPFLTARASATSLEQALRLARISISVGMIPTAIISAHYLRAYASSRASGVPIVLSSDDWEILAQSAIAAESLVPSRDERMEDAQIPVTLESILEGILKSGADISYFDKQVIRRIVTRLLTRHDVATVESMVSPFGPLFKAMLLDDVNRAGSTANSEYPNQPLSIKARFPPSAPTSHVHVDMFHGKFVDEYFPAHPQVTPVMAYGRFEAGMRTGVYPRPEVIARLISSLGRLGEKDKVHVLYDAAQLVLATMEQQKEWQSVGWFQVEDHMVIGLAHAGDIDGAHVHRMRIIEQGGSPSADAYGALIHLVKDTTDDTSNAMALFQESQARGVSPNIYLFNTIISKLAKARKADHALELFQQMKARQIWPTSVTYGAVIAACCRVGDAQSAEHLFEEMLNQRNFKPRVPPYNTMMQLYTHTKPDRERVLYYYEALRAANVKPTAHTFKLLMDAYGTIQPVDIPAMEKVFAHLTSGSKPMIQSTHWASLINAWGCGQKDLDKALAIFDSIATHPSTKLTGAPLPDAVVFEALINVLVMLRRTDLIPVYVEHLSSYRIHMTAYIANLLIKGYATAGDIDRARAVFESLVDPPEGMAALHNHAPHDNDPHSIIQVPEEAPVYREPSTWEAMVRAELGNGNRDQAVAILERAQARKFPPAVYNRISGIMLDDSVSPWPSSATASTPEAC